MHRSALVCLCWILGCGDDSSPSDGTTDATSSSSSSEESSSSGGDPSAPRIEATIDATMACDGATMLQFTATRFACVSAGPCTVGNPPTPIIGDTEICPSDAGERTFTVELTQGGRYHVELVATLSNGTTIDTCYSNDGSQEVVVGNAEIDSGAVITVTPVGGACPDS